MATQLNESSLKSCHRLLENKDHPSSSPLNTCETLQGISLLQIRAECCFLQGEQTSYLLKIINSLLGQDPAKAGLESLTQGAKNSAQPQRRAQRKHNCNSRVGRGKGEENCHKCRPRSLPAPSCYHCLALVSHQWCGDCHLPLWSAAGIFTENSHHSECCKLSVLLLQRL